MSDTTIVINSADRADIGHAYSLRKTHPALRKVLKQASLGKPVEIALLRSALFAAMRSATTANGQSMGRRKDAEAIERAWNRLPGSPAEVANLDLQAQLSADVDALKAALATAKRHLDDQTAALERTAASLTAERAERRRVEEQTAETVREALANNRVLDYALSIAPANLSQRIRGFRDGIRS